jgi:peptidoglycan/LPS O-acetylase OafA/YrhL
VFYLRIELAGAERGQPAVLRSVAGVSSSSRFYIPQLDGLRFFAFLGVFLSHFGANEPSAAGGVRWYHAAWWGHSTVIAGGFGVVLFFVLSSYLITTLLVRELDTRGRIVMEHPTVYLRAGGAGAATLIFFVVAFACGGLLLAALAGSAWLSRPWLVYLGRIPYGLYVFHGMAIWLVGAWWWPWRLPAAFVVTLVAAAVSYRFLELPFLRLKSRFTHVRSGDDRIGLSPRKGNKADPVLGKEHENNFRLERVPVDAGGEH